MMNGLSPIRNDRRKYCLELFFFETHPSIYTLVREFMDCDVYFLNFFILWRVLNFLSH